jgi:hypothetical protein
VRLKGQSDWAHRLTDFRREVLLWTAARRETMGWTVAPRLALLSLISGGLAALVAGNVWLWTCYGATIFFETIRVGLVACFG